ncbi:MAG: U32 family peptidase [Bacteriovoracaceae bacterium]
MKMNCYLEKIEDLANYQHISEVILQVKEFSRFGKISIEQAHSMAKLARAAGKQVALEWDILMTENVFRQTIKLIEQIDFSLFDNIRVQDPGAVQWMIDHQQMTKVALILETGNHNYLGIEAWCKSLGQQLSKVVLSIELPHERLKNFCEKLHQRNIEVELLGLGRILLFYTPRSLLLPVVYGHEDDKEKIVHGEILERLASSEESPHKGFPVVESSHGTFMFHIKEHWLLENINELMDMKLDWLRIDLRFGKDKSLMIKIADQVLNPTTTFAQALKEIYPADLIKGFFNVNKTDVLFGKLKNMKLQRKDENYIGDVYEVLKEDCLIFMNRHKNLPIKVGLELVIINPDGKEIHATIKKLRNSEAKDVDSIAYEQLAVINYIGSVVARSQVYLKDL